MCVYGHISFWALWMFRNHFLKAEWESACYSSTPHVRPFFFLFLLQGEVNANNVPIEGLSIQHPQVRAACGSGCDLSWFTKPVSHAERLCSLDRPGGSLPHLVFSLLHLEQLLSCFLSSFSHFIPCHSYLLSVLLFVSWARNVKKKKTRKINKTEQINKSL